MENMSLDMMQQGELEREMTTEPRIMAMPEIDIAAVVAVPHARWDERPVAADCSATQIACRCFMSSFDKLVSTYRAGCSHLSKLAQVVTLAKDGSAENLLDRVRRHLSSAFAKFQLPDDVLASCLSLRGSVSDRNSISCLHS